MPFGLCLKDFLPVMQCGCVWLSNAFEDAHRYVDRSVCWVELDFSVGHFLFFCFFFFLHFRHSNCCCPVAAGVKFIRTELCYCA